MTNIIQNVKTETENWWLKHSNKVKKIIQLFKAIIVALIGGYIFQCIPNIISSLIIFGKILPELLIPEWRTLILVAYAFYVALPMFGVVDRIKWLKLTFFLLTILASAIVIWLIVSYAKMLI